MGHSLLRKWNVLDETCDRFPSVQGMTAIGTGAERVMRSICHFLWKWNGATEGSSRARLSRGYGAAARVVRQSGPSISLKLYISLSRE